MHDVYERLVKSELFEDEPTSQFSFPSVEPVARSPHRRSSDSISNRGTNMPLYCEGSLMPPIHQVPDQSIDELSNRVAQANIQHDPPPTLFDGDDNLRGADEYRHGETSQHDPPPTLFDGDDNLRGADEYRHGETSQNTAPSSSVPTRISDRLKTKDKTDYRHMLKSALDYAIMTSYTATRARKTATAKNNGAKLTNERKSRSNRANKNKMMTFEIGPKRTRPRSARLNVPAPPLPDMDLLAVPTRSGPTTRSMMTLVHIPIGILCALEPKRNSRARKRTKDTTYRSRSASMRKRVADAEANYHLFVESHPNAKFRDLCFVNENDLHNARNNSKKGHFVNTLIRAHENLTKLVRRPFTPEDIENVVSNSFVGITPHEYDLAVKELVHLVIQNDGVLWLAADKRFPELTGTHIIKEQETERLNKMDCDMDASVEI